MKRLNESIKSYEELKEKSSFLFNLHLKENKLKFYYLDKEEDKIEISKEDEYQNVVKCHLEDNSGSIMKITLETEKVNVDEMLNNLRVSESIGGDKLSSEPLNNVIVNTDLKEDHNDINQKEENKISSLSGSIIIESSYQEVKKPEDSIKINEEKEEPKFNIEEEVNTQIIKNEENKLNPQANTNINSENKENSDKKEDDEFLNIKPTFSTEFQVNPSISEKKLEKNVGTNPIEQKEAEVNVNINNNNIINPIDEEKISIKNENLDNINRESVIVNNVFDEKSFMLKMEDLINKKFDQLEEKFLESYRKSLINIEEESKKKKKKKNQ